MYYFNFQNLYLFLTEHQNFCEDINNLRLHLLLNGEHYIKLTFNPSTGAF